MNRLIPATAAVFTASALYYKFVKMNPVFSDQFAVTSYNVLAKELCSPEFFQVENPEFLNFGKRQELIRARISTFLKRDDIVCLQETDPDLLEDLFANNGYFTLASYYSTMPGRGSFGNSISFPTKKFRLVESGRVKLGDSIVIPDDATNIGIPLPLPDGTPRKILKPLSEEVKRDTTTMWVKLINIATGNEVVIITEHMPCAFWYPEVMNGHASELKKLVAKLTDDHRIPFAVAGAFNTMPNTPIHRYLQGDDFAFEEKPLYKGWTPFSNFKDVMVEDFDARGPVPERQNVFAWTDAHQEKTLTTWCKNKFGAEFKETIDYIFYSGLDRMTSIVQTPTELIPNAEHGSDHVPISATFRFTSVI